MITWNPLEHSNDENTRWSLLRAIEWSRWPLFISQSIAPLLMYIVSWKIILLGLFLIDIFWELRIKYNYINLFLASFGALFDKLKWITCPIMAYYFYVQKDFTNGIIALFWPGVIVIMIFIEGVVVSFITGEGNMTGRIQKIFMVALGYGANDSVVENKNEV